MSKAQQVLDLLREVNVKEGMQQSLDAALKKNKPDHPDHEEEVGESKDEVKDILLALNAGGGSFGMKYPIGNADLTAKVKKLEADGKICYDKHFDKWVKGKCKKEEAVVKSTDTMGLFNTAFESAGKDLKDSSVKNPEVYGENIGRMSSLDILTGLSVEDVEGYNDALLFLKGFVDGVQKAAEDK